MTRRPRTQAIAAARWPLILVGSVVLVPVVAATPFVVYGLVIEVASRRTATWVTLIAGVLMGAVLAAAWVKLRQRRLPDAPPGKAA